MLAVALALRVYANFGHTYIECRFVITLRCINTYGRTVIVTHFSCICVIKIGDKRRVFGKRCFFEFINRHFTFLLAFFFRFIHRNLFGCLFGNRFGQARGVRLLCGRRRVTVVICARRCHKY